MSVLLLSSERDLPKRKNFDKYKLPVMVTTIILIYYYYSYWKMRVFHFYGSVTQPY